MLAHSGLSNAYWAEAIGTASYLHNLLPNSTLGGNTTPHEMWTGKRPDVSHLQVFGCAAYAHIPAEHRRKLDSKATKMIMVGYSRGTSGHRLIDKTSRRMLIRKDVIFNESDLKRERRVAEVRGNQEVTLENIDAVKTVPEERVPERERPEPEKRAERVKRNTRAPDRLGIEQVHAASEETEHIAYVGGDIGEPTTMTEALNSPEREQWKAAAEDEIKSLNDHETWTLAQLPPDRRVVGSKWVFKTKYNSEGEIDRFKCRLVAQGYSQREGIDYTETFAPVAKFATIRSLLALAVERGMHIHQMDVKTAFLNGTLEETIFMKLCKRGSESKNMV